MSDHELSQHHSDSDEDSSMEEKVKEMEKTLDHGSDHESVRLSSHWLPVPYLSCTLYSIGVAPQLYLHSTWANHSLT